MQSANEKIARLAALTLVFSYAELLVPRIIPFFRLGLGNAALLMGLELSFWSFMLLSVIKSVAANLMAGTLFSPFFLVSLAQSVMSALLMFTLSRAGRRRALLSLYGISVAGSAVSAVIQILLSSLYLGQGTWSLLGPMLLFNIASGIITAWLAETLSDIREGESLPLAPNTVASTGSTTNFRIRHIFLLVLILVAAATVFFIKNTYILCVFLFIALIAQKLSKRKIRVIPHLSLWLFAIISSVLVPNGRVLISVFGFSITQGALLTGIQKALRLSAVSAFSQCAVTVRPKENSLTGLTLNYYKLMLDSFVNTQGSVFKKMHAALSTQQPEPSQNQKEEK